MRRGIVYVDECNFHLRDVRITWPAHFKPKCHLFPVRKAKARVTNDTTGSATRGTMSTGVRGDLGPGWHPVSTRAILEQLAEQHSVQFARSSNPDDLFRQSAIELSTLPDASGRQVSIEFVPPVPVRSQQQSRSNVQDDACSNSSPPESSQVELDESSIDVDPSEIVCLTQPKSPLSTVTRPPPSAKSIERTPPPLHWELDDEAACFNTEAFMCNLPASGASQSETVEYAADKNPSPAHTLKLEIDAQDAGVVGGPLPWDQDEDRQLLDFAKTKDAYSSRIFYELEALWVSNPLSTHGRTAPELEARFRYLMRIALGDDYDSDLFLSPPRSDSS